MDARCLATHEQVVGNVLVRPTRRHWREAEARLVAGADATSTAVLRAARHAALDLGATQLVDEVEQLAGWHRVDLVPVIAEPLPDAFDVHALTPSETEVLGYPTTSGWVDRVRGGVVAVVPTQVVVALGAGSSLIERNESAGVG